MSKMRQKYWVPKLRSLVKSVRHNCNHCKRYRELKTSEGAAHICFTNIPNEIHWAIYCGVDFAGPLLYKSRRDQTSNWRRLSHCLLLQALGPYTSDPVQGHDSWRVQSTKKWLSTLRKNEVLFNHLATKGIAWKFNLARAPWTASLEATRSSLVTGTSLRDHFCWYATLK